MKRQFLSKFAFLTMLTFSMSGLLWAQQTSSIHGSVVDGNGDSLPGVRRHDRITQHAGFPISDNNRQMANSCSGS